MSEQDDRFDIVHDCVECGIGPCDCGEVLAPGEEGCAMCFQCVEDREREQDEDDEAIA